MTRAEALDAVRWFATCGDRYVEAYLGRVDAQRLTVDREYALKLFFFVWAFERNGAPRSYRIAAVKAISSLESSQRELPALFKNFCHGGLNPKLNPIIARSIVHLCGQGGVGPSQQIEMLTLSPKVRPQYALSRTLSEPKRAP